MKFSDLIYDYVYDILKVSLLHKYKTTIGA